MLSTLPAPLNCLTYSLLLARTAFAAPVYDAAERAKLPYQISGLVGAYVVTVLIWGILLLTIGRRMRRKTENSPKSLELQLVTKQPTLKTPVSPSSARSATSWIKKPFKRGSASEASSVRSPNSPVVNSPTSFDQKVIDADRERAQTEMERLYAAVMDHDRKKSSSQVNVTAARDESNAKNIPRRINTSARPDGTQSNPGSPRSPVKAIYPPNYIQNGPPTAPLPRINTKHDDRPSSPRSILSRKSRGSIGSSGSKTRFNLKNLRISGPVQKYPGSPADDEARTPLSPAFYHPGAPPSPPTNQNSPTSPDEVYEDLDAVQPLPHPAPQRKGSHPLSNNHTAKSATSSSNSLPLRGYTPEGPLSPDLKTTYLDRRLDHLSLTTPKTGVPYTPYSPYMPFTPITPVTPHLVTKKERRSERKREGRKVKTREDLVQSPKEIFGDAY